MPKLTFLESLTETIGRAVSAATGARVRTRRVEYDIGKTQLIVEERDAGGEWNRVGSIPASERGPQR